MKRYLWIFAVLPFLWSCIAEDSSACPQPRGVSVRMSVCPDPMTAVTRTTDEEALRDLNFYLLDADGNVVQHRYQSSPTLRFECLPGNYLLRIAANMGRDLGENPASEDFTVTHADEYDTLPMSYEGDVTITSSSGGILTLPVVEVQRVVTKVSYDIAVKPADIELRSVQLCSVSSTWRPGRRTPPTTTRTARKAGFRDSIFRGTAICFRICRARFRPLPTSAIRIRTMPPRMRRIF